MKTILLLSLLMPLISFADFLEFRGKTYQCVEQVTNYEVANCMFKEAANLQLRTGTYIEISGLAKNKEHQDMIKTIYGVPANPGDRTIPSPLLKVADSDKRLSFDLFINDRLEFNENDEVIKGCLPQNTEQLFFHHERSGKNYYLGTDWPYRLRVLEFKNGYANVLDIPGHYYGFEAPLPASAESFYGEIYFYVPNNWNDKDVANKYCQDEGFDSAINVPNVSYKLLIGKNVYNLGSGILSRSVIEFARVIPFRLRDYIQFECGFKELKIKL